MMKRGTIFCLCLLFTFMVVNAQSFLDKDQEMFVYEIKYGWIKIGEAQLVHQRKDSVIALDVLAYTTGIVNWIARLRDSIHAEIDKITYKPRYSFMNRSEGKYQRKQEDHYDFDMDSVYINVYEMKADKHGHTKLESYHLRDSTFDMLSSYMYLRSQPWEAFNQGDSVMLNMFYEDEYYPFGIEYVGIEEIETEFGPQTCHKAYILFPISGTFPEKYMVKVWVTVDERKWPLRVEAKMKFGKAVCELIEIH